MPLGIRKPNSSPRPVKPITRGEARERLIGASPGSSGCLLRSDQTGTGRDRCGPLKRETVRGRVGSRSDGDNAAEIVAVTRSDARASLTYSREAVIDNDADLLAALVGEGGVHRDPADEQLNDLLPVGL